MLVKSQALQHQLSLKSHLNTTAQKPQISSSKLSKSGIDSRCATSWAKFLSIYEAMKLCVTSKTQWWDRHRQYRFSHLKMEKNQKKELLVPSNKKNPAG
jgi:hypothetical protein